MGGEHQRHLAARSLREARQSLLDVLDHRLDEAGVIVKDPQLFDHRSPRAGLLAGADDIVEILAAAGIGTERGGHESKRATNAVVPHLAQRIGHQRMPIAVPPVDGQARSVFSSSAVNFVISSRFWALIGLLPPKW